MCVFGLAWVCVWPWLGLVVKCGVKSQCVSSQAFFLRLAGFITATNHWLDKSSYFILPSFTSALLLHFSSLFYFPKTSLPLVSPDSTLASSCFTLHPAWLTLSFPSLCNSPIFYFLWVLLIVFPSSIQFPYLYSFFYFPPHHLLLRSSLYLPPPSFSIVWWICRQGLIIVLQPKCSFFFVFESCDRQELFFLYPPVPPLLLLPSLALFSFYPHTIGE